MPYFILLFLLIFNTNIFASTHITTIITKVHDGDTVRFEYNGKSVPGRLSCIDAPELKQRYGIESRDFLRNSVLDKYVNIKIEDKKDRYNRYLVTLYFGAQNINQVLVSKGLAWNYYSCLDYKLEQQKAKRNKRNIWSDTDNPPINPKTFRKMQNPRYTVRLQDHPKLACQTNDFKTCSMFSNCKEAMFWFKNCEHTYLDGNSNNIPCERLCSD